MNKKIPTGVLWIAISLIIIGVIVQILAILPGFGC